MNSAIFFYVMTLLIYGALFGMQAIGFNLQFGFAGIINLAYILSVAVGAYFTAIAAIHPAATEAGVESYIGGFGWAFPWDVIFGTACAIGFTLILGILAFSRLHEDYLAVTMVIIGQGALVLVSDYPPLFNAQNGLQGIPPPFSSVLNTTGPGYQLAFFGLSVAVLAGVWALVARITRGPFGRVLKAIREDEVACASLRKNVFRFKLWAFVVGGGVAGVSGSLLVTYDGAWNTAAWQLTETLILLAAVIVGGRGRNVGAFIGCLVVVVGITEATRYLPSFGNANLLASLQVVASGVLILIFIWYRPQGLLPERRENFRGLGVDVP